MFELLGQGQRLLTPLLGIAQAPEKLGHEDELGDPEMMPPMVGRGRELQFTRYLHAPVIP